MSIHTHTGDTLIIAKDYFNTWNNLCQLKNASRALFHFGLASQWQNFASNSLSRLFASKVSHVWCYNFLIIKWTKFHFHFLCHSHFVWAHFFAAKILIYTYFFVLFRSGFFWVRGQNAGMRKSFINFSSSWWWWWRQWWESCWKQQHEF